MLVVGAVDVLLEVVLGGRMVVVVEATDPDSTPSG